MSFNARWRHTKIVAPEMPDREQELIGGLQNALLRGESIAKAKQSFISAGYKPQEIEAAAQNINITSKIAQQTSASLNPIKQQSQSSTTTPKPNQKKQISKKFLIILISIAVLILISTALLGLFWDKIF